MAVLQLLYNLGVPSGTPFTYLIQTYTQTFIINVMKRRIIMATLTYSKEEKTFKTPAGPISVPDLINLAIWKHGPRYPLHAVVSKIVMAYSLGDGDDYYLGTLINKIFNSWCDHCEYYEKNPDKLRQPQAA
jgi:hypothetical protein